MYPPLKEKCKEYIEKSYCLGCNALEDPYFTGNDNCYFIKQREHELYKYNNWIVNDNVKTCEQMQVSINDI